jgi:hypothetical protein
MKKISETDERLVKKYHVIDISAYSKEIKISCVRAIPSKNGKSFRLIFRNILQDPQTIVDLPSKEYSDTPVDAAKNFVLKSEKRIALLQEEINSLHNSINVVNKYIETGEGIDVKLCESYY